MKYLLLIVSFFILLFLHVNIAYSTSDIAVLSDKHIYKFGEQAKISWIVPDGVNCSTFVISIFDPNGNSIITDQVTNPFSEYAISGNLWNKQGIYNIKVQCNAVSGTKPIGVIISELIPESDRVNVTTDKTSYRFGETILESYVAPTDSPGGMYVAKILAPDGRAVVTMQGKDTHNLFTMYDIFGPDGTYTLEVQHGSYFGSTLFTVSKSNDLPPPTHSKTDSDGYRLAVMTDNIAYSYGETIIVSWYPPKDYAGQEFTVSVTDSQHREILSEKTFDTTRKYNVKGSLWQKTGMYEVIVSMYGGYRGTTQFGLMEKATILTTKTSDLPRLEKSTSGSISIDKTVYSYGSPIKVTGKFSPYATGQQVTFQIVAPNGDLVKIDQFKSDEITYTKDTDGPKTGIVFSKTYQIEGDQWKFNGIYTVTTSYLNKNFQTKFVLKNVPVKTPLNPIPASKNSTLSNQTENAIKKSDVIQDIKTKKAELIKKAKESAKKRSDERKAKLKSPSDLIKTD
ncbi:MAG: hypothetical protein HZA82_05575 [Thaumarchaeota archaeon]|nr:hypothetical protein [Nitrososphaerota archaeon]